MLVNANPPPSGDFSSERKLSPQNFLFRGIGLSLLASFLLLFSTPVFAAITCGDSNNVCVVTGTISSDTNFIDANTYVISGAVIFSGADVDLNMAPGTVVKYTNSTASAIRITNGAILSANGTAAQNIIFTSCRDQTYGVNTSTVTGCTGTLGMQDYNTALTIQSDAGNTNADSVSYLKILYATTGMQVDMNLGSIHDANFSYFARRASTAPALLLSQNTSTNVYHNHFDTNANATAGGYYGIRIDGDFQGNIYDNNFTPNRGAYGIYLNTAAVQTGNIYDNNITAYLGNGIFSASTAASTGSIYHNYFDVNANGTASTYTGIRLNSDFSGNIYDNNAFLTLAAQWLRVQSGAFSGDVYNNDVNAD